MRASRQDAEQQTQVNDEHKATGLVEDKLTFNFPTRPDGKFAQVMSSVACNPVSGAKGGVVSRLSNHNDTFSEQVSQALAIKLNLKTAQHANEKALCQLLQKGTYNGELKQTIQARSAVYGAQLDPS